MATFQICVIQSLYEREDIDKYQTSWAFGCWHFEKHTSNRLAFVCKVFVGAEICSSLYYIQMKAPVHFS